MGKIVLPGIPDVFGITVSDDTDLKNLLIAIKITLEKITSATNTEFTELLDENE